MGNVIHPWKRFWCQRDGVYAFGSDGYLVDPDAAGRYAPNTDLKTIEDIETAPCLVFLGEPGIGKSSAIASVQEDARKKATEGGQVLTIDLRSVGSEERLVQKVFDNPTFRSWVEGSHRLSLFLDSLDECMLRVTTIASLLADELREYPIERLTLRIACRTAVWPAVLEKALSSMWGEQDTGIYELLPLRKVDVATALQGYSLDPEPFFRELAAMNAVPFAIRPITLDFLLRTYAQNGRLPNSQHALYREGCRILCEEVNESRRAAGDTGYLTAEERLAIAARIAALTVFCRKFAVHTGADKGAIPDLILSLRSLAGGTEPVGNGNVSVTEAAIRETLDTGLFTSRGSDLMGFAHQTYAEYLAAFWVAQHGLAPGKICRLIEHSSVPEHKIVPQLHETAAWIATENMEILDRVVETEPQVLLLSDIAALDSETLGRVATKFLSLFDEDRLSARRIPPAEHLRKLKHPGLAELIRPYLKDGSRRDAGRMAAVEIAEACRLVELQDELAHLALDTSESYPLRVRASYAVSRIADAVCRSLLLPLAQSSEGEDPDDELRGCAITGLWPDCISAAQLFVFLTRPYHPNLYGAYKAFLMGDFIQHLKPEDLPVALAWVSEQNTDHLSLHPFAEPMAAVFRMALDHLDSPDIFEAVGELVYRRMHSYGSLPSVFGQEDDGQGYQEDDAKRRRLIALVVERIGDDDRELGYLAFSHPGWLVRRDCSWLLEQSKDASTEVTRRGYARLLKYAIDWTDEAQFEVLYEACLVNETLKEEFRAFLGPIRLDSELADVQREAHKQMCEHQESAGKRRHPITPPPGERVRSRLEAFEAGDLNAWIPLNVELQLTRDSREYNIALADLASTPGWKEADETTRERIMAAATRFLIETDPQSADWLGTNSFPHAVLSGYRALRLLLAYKLEETEALPADVWAKWAPITLAFPNSSLDTCHAKHVALVAIVYRHAPAEIIETLLFLIDRENAIHGTAFVLSSMAECWDRQLADSLVDKLTDPVLSPSTFGILMEHLMNDGGAIEDVCDRTQGIAKDMVSGFLEGRSDRQHALAAAYSLLTSVPQVGWEAVWPVVKQNADFGRQVFEDIAYREHRHGQLLEALSEDQLADLYLWLETQYPCGEDPQHKEVEAHFVGPDESVRTWRDAILRHLQQRGTATSCAAIQRIADASPHLAWLSDILKEAQDLTLRSTWEPLRPQEVLELVSQEGENMKIKVLFVAANPFGTEPLALDEEIRSITQKIRAAEHRDAIEVKQIWATRPDDLLQALLEHKPHVVHFSGHGSADAEIILLDNDGNAKPIAPETLAAIFGVLKDNIQVVVLNACYSLAQAQAIIQHIPCSVGMNQSIGDEAARVFAASFYQAIAFGRSVKDAFDLGLASLRLQGIDEHETPEILTKEGVDSSLLYLVR